MLKEITGQYNAGEIESKIHVFWDGIDAYSKVRSAGMGAKVFFFVDGPPYTTVTYIWYCME